MNYKVITHLVPLNQQYNKNEFEAKVLEALRDGYVPVGGVSVTYIENKIQYSQAVMKQ